MYSMILSIFLFQKILVDSTHAPGGKRGLRPHGSRKCTTAEAVKLKVALLPDDNWGVFCLSSVGLGLGERKRRG